MTERGMSAAVLSAVNWAGKQVNSRCAIRSIGMRLNLHPFSRCAALSAVFTVRKAEWLPGPDANIRPIRLQPRSEVLCFQQCDLVTGCTQKMRKLCSETKTDTPAQRISDVFVCIFLLLQREMRG